MPTREAPSRASLDQLIRARSLSYVIEQSRLGLLTVLVMTSALGSIFVPAAGIGLFLLWWVPVLVGFIGRQVWFEQLRKRPDTPDERRVTWVTTLSAFTGWLVMLSLPIFGPRISAHEFILLVGLMLAWIAGAVSVLAVQPRVYLGYLIACLSTVAFALWQRFGATEINVLALALPLGGLMMYRLAHGIRQLLNEAVAEGMRSETLAGQLEQALHETRQAFELRSRFLASASHDLKQPVHALSLLVNVLRRSADETRRQQVMHEIEHASRSIDSMFSGLMDMARIDAGNLRAHLTGVDLVPLLKTTLAGYPELCAQKGVTFALRVNGAPVVRADPLLLQRVLGNLLDNALKFTTTGGVTVEVAERGDSVILSVTDTGPGIEPAELDALFKPFSRGRQAQSLGVPGLGLGLAIVRHMVALMGMTLQVDATPGYGSVFALTLSRERRAAEVPVESTVNASLAGLNVLLVEDDQLAREATSHWLREAGASVTAVASDQEAMAAPDQAGRPDLLIADYNLGDEALTGGDIAVRLQQRFPQLPCIIVTGEGSAALTHVQGVVLRKPLSAPALARAVQELLHAGR